MISSAEGTEGEREIGEPVGSKDSYEATTERKRGAERRAEGRDGGGDG